MRFGPWLMLCLLCSVVAQAQQTDSLFAKQQAQIESIRQDFYQKSDSLKQKYVSKFALLSVSKDSLSQQLPTISNSTDSLNSKRLALIHSLQNGIDSLKQQTTRKLNQLNLPEEASAQVTKFSNELESFKLPVNDLPIEGIPDLQLPSLDFSKTAIEIPNLNTSLPSIPTDLNVGDRVSDISNYAKEAEQLSTGLDQVEAIPEVLENKALETSGLATVTEQAKNIDLPNIQDSDQLKQEAIEQAKEVAVDHFAGKEQELTGAMTRISKLKQKYSSVTSLNEIPKRKPNQMRGKPIIERLRPQVVFQILKQGDDVLVDWANYVGWRFTSDFTAGAGWNQRIGYSTEKNSFHNQKRVYGPRVFAEYKWTKGFKPRVEFEYMRTFLPPHANGSKQDPVVQQWVGAALIGLKKDYKFFGKVRGTTTIMFRIAGDKYKSPYNDVLNMRFGFDFPMKKKRPVVQQ